MAASAPRPTCCCCRRPSWPTTMLRRMPFQMAGYELLHHGEGRWNGVAIASRVGIDRAHHQQLRRWPVRESRSTKDSPTEDDWDPLDRSSHGQRRVRRASVSSACTRPTAAPSTRSGTRASCAGSSVCRPGSTRSHHPTDAVLLGGDLNVTPTDDDVWDAAAAHGSTHVSDRERAALARLRDWGLVDTYRQHQPATDRFSWYDYRAGMFHKNQGMRIDLLYGYTAVADRVVWAEIDREARKGPPTPSDHAPVVIDLESPARPSTPAGKPRWPGSGSATPSYRRDAAGSPGTGPQSRIDADLRRWPAHGRPRSAPRRDGADRPDRR